MANQRRVPAMPRELADAARERPPQISQDSLRRLRELVADARDLEQRKKQLEEQLKEVSRKLNGDDGLYFKKLPDMMDEIGVQVITLAAEGNMPAVTASVGPFYAANIGVKWPDQRREAALAWLDDNGHGDLIKTEVTLSFKREDREAARAFVTEARKYGTPVIEETVHHGTLTAWLREQVEEIGYVPPLDIIGGTVARSVKLKTVKT